MIKILLTLTGTSLYGVLSRMHGGGFIDLPFGLDAVLYAVAYGVVGFLVGGPWGALVAFAFAMLGKRLGHGQYMDLGTWNKPVEPEKLDPLVHLFFGPDSFDNPLRDFAGLAWTGAFVAFGLFLVLASKGMFIEAALVLLGGAMKSVAYLIGWKTPLKEIFDPTETGEFLTGIFGALPVFVILSDLIF